MFLREVLANQSIGVFIQTLFPGRKRMGKVHTSAERFGQGLMIGKFLAIIDRDGVYPRAKEVE